MKKRRHSTGKQMMNQKYLPSSFRQAQSFQALMLAPLTFTSDDTVNIINRKGLVIPMHRQLLESLSPVAARVISGQIWESNIANKIDPSLGQDSFKQGSYRAYGLGRLDPRGEKALFFDEQILLHEPYHVAPDQMVVNGWYRVCLPGETLERRLDVLSAPGHSVHAARTLPSPLQGREIFNTDFLPVLDLSACSSATIATTAVAKALITWCYLGVKGLEAARLDMHTLLGVASVGDALEINMLRGDCQIVVEQGKLERREMDRATRYISEHDRFGSHRHERQKSQASRSNKKGETPSKKVFYRHRG